MLWHKIQGAAGGVGGTDISTLFNTTNFTGNGTGQSVVTGLDLSSNEGFIWFYRTAVAETSISFNTILGAGEYLNMSDGAPSTVDATTLTAFNSDGFTVGSDTLVNRNLKNFAVWTFLSDPVFADVVQYVGNWTARTVAHNLDGVPGAILVTSQVDTNVTNSDWFMWHRRLDGGVAPEEYAVPMASGTAAQDRDFNIWNSTAPTDAVFSLGASNKTNKDTQEYTALIFAHDTGPDGLVQCGEYTGNGSTTGPVITLGWEPQWLLIKSATRSEWGGVYDNVTTPSNPRAQSGPFEPDTGTSAGVDFTSTGFQPKTTNFSVNQSGQQFVYIAIRKAD